jgi:hypothetical protein
MELEIKSFLGPNFCELETQEKVDIFSGLFQVLIGEKGKDMAGFCTIAVRTPLWLMKNYAPEDVLIGLPHIIVFKYNYDAVVRYVTKYIEKLEADNWESIATDLNILGKWEFCNAKIYQPPQEDYRRTSFNIIDAEIKHLSSPDIENLVAFQPLKPDNFAFNLKLTVTEKNNDLEENFDFVVSTPQWLITHHKPEDIVLGWPRITMFTYNYEALVNQLKEYLYTIEEESWDKVIRKICSVGRWNNPRKLKL